MRKFLILGLSLLLCGFEPKPPGSGETADLPAPTHMRNVGGSDGSGLCVFTSAQHAGIFQNIVELDGFRQWMQTQPGGGWPEKLDGCIQKFCALKGRKPPSYIQHTGGDEEFLEQTLRTSRIVCVTYAGRDDFYRGETIAHMVNLVYLDATSAAILDNNRPGVMLWMTRKEFLDRWRGVDASGNPLRIGRISVGGGWAVAFLAPPPTPHVKVKGDEWAYGGKCKCKEGCGCGDKDRCWCVREGQPVFGQCANGQCQVPVILTVPPTPLDGWVQTTEPAVLQLYNKGVFLGQFDERGFHKATSGGEKVSPETSALPEGTPPPHITGVDSARLTRESSYRLNGAPVARQVAFAALQASPGVADDTNRWHLAVVGDLKYLAAAKVAYDALPGDVRGKLLVQFYTPDSWTAKENGWTKGAFLFAPTTTRFSDLLGSVDDWADLLKLLKLPGGPLYTPETPKDPTVPVDPTVPQPKPNYLVWLLVAAGLLVLLMSRKKAT